MSRYPLITIEGPDGAGKTTMIEMLFNELTEKGYAVKQYRHPGETDVGKMVRSMLVESDTAITPMSQALLILANRVQLAEEAICKDINNGVIVLVDRWDLSTVIYQTCVYENEQQKKRGDNAAVAESVFHFHERLRRVVDLTAPEIDVATILLDADDEILDERRPFKGDDRFEAMDAAFKQSLRRMYRSAKSSAMTSGPCYMVNTNSPLGEEEYDGIIDFILSQRMEIDGD